jgi:tetratricopeptide (TPR) repeat protein
MHPSTVQLQTFGRCRLASAPARAVLRHLRGGCDQCWVELSPYLIPWLDGDAAAEARVIGPLGAGNGLRAAYIQAAERAARAAATNETKGESDVSRALRALELDGLTALGRLPRQLLGRPAILALLQLNRKLGVADPGSRLLLGELACDLACMLPDDPRERRLTMDLRCRAALDFATSLRILGHHRAAQEQLNQAAEELLRGPYDAMLAAQLIEFEAALLGDQYRLRTARAGLLAAISAYRQGARRAELARALIRYGTYSSYADEFDVAMQSFDEALCLIDRDREPVLAASALGNACDTLLMSGRWHEGLRWLRRHRPVLARDPSLLNAARISRLEGRLLKLTGDIAGAARAFAASRRIFATSGKRYVAGAVLLDQAAALEREGEMAGASALVLEATDVLLDLEPQREVFLALTFLRGTRRFSDTRNILPLERVIDFLDVAEFNPSIRLQAYLG